MSRQFQIETSCDVLALVDDDGVLEEIADVDCFAAAFDFRMFLHEQPADVREEETAASVVRICIRFTEFVVYPVIPTPLVNVILSGDQWSVELHVVVKVIN